MPEKLKTVWETFFLSGWWIAILVFSCAFPALTYLHGRFWARLLKRKGLAWSAGYQAHVDGD